MIDDETQHSPTEHALDRQTGPRAWMRRLLRANGPRAVSSAQDRQASNRFGVQETLRVLPTLLDGASLPDGVVELLLEDSQAPTRQLLDIHDGHVKLIEPGQCVPWASIAGSPSAWALALGPQRDTKQLQLTGDEQLARRFLAAIPQRC